MSYSYIIEFSAQWCIFNNYSLDKHRHQIWDQFLISVLKTEITNWCIQTIPINEGHSCFMNSDIRTFIYKMFSYKCSRNNITSVSWRLTWWAEFPRGQQLTGVFRRLIGCIVGTVLRTVLRAVPVHITWDCAIHVKLRHKLTLNFATIYHKKLKNGTCLFFLTDFISK